MIRVKIVLILALLISTDGSVFGQRNKNQRLYAIGLNAGEHGVDVGAGIEVGITPFASPRIFTRLRSNVNWMERYKADTDHWITYQSIALTLSYNFISHTRAKIYGEAGPFVLLKQKATPGNYASEGFTTAIGTELDLSDFSQKKLSYYFTLGWDYINSWDRADQYYYTAPDGIAFNTGFRLYMTRSQNK